jgi:aldehyde dehydrogenase (NAD+)
VKLVEENEEEIAAALHSDLKKSKYESYICEIKGVDNSCKLTIENLHKWMAPEKRAVPIAVWPASASIVPEPLGVALIISPWNFPFLLAFDPIIGAIAAGCTICLKPSEISPATSSLLARLVPEYLDSDAIQVVEGGVPEITALLEQKWDKIFYTGNSKVGRIILGAAAKHLTPVTLELGGKCPVFIDDTVDLKVASNRILVGKFGSNSGQACIAPDYILVEEHFAPKLIKQFQNSLVEFFGKDPSTSLDLSRIVSKNHFQRLSSLLDDPSTAEKIVHGGERDEKTLYIAPTLLENPPLDSPIMTEEIFGPLLPIIAVRDVNAALDLINDRPKPLAVYIFTANKDYIKRFTEETSSGGLVVNDCVLQFVATDLPFGGVGESGTGAYHGKASFDSFSHKKSVLVRSMKGEVSARYPPFTAKKQSLIRALLAGRILDVVLITLGLKKAIDYNH